MPNSGELRSDGLFGMVDSASKKGIYTTFIGIGVDFNNNLVERVSKTKGANYYSVHSQKEFKQRLDEEFDYMVTPLVFDLKLTLNGDKIEAVYGSPEADRATGDIMYVNTLFPSPSQNGASKGGIILIKVKDTKDLKLSVSYKNREGESFRVSKDIKFTNSNDKATKKAIQLSDYVTIAKNWILDSRINCNDKVEHYHDIQPVQKRCMIYPPNRPIYKKIKTWEIRSFTLRVSDCYKKLFSLFLQEFKGDDFTKEIETIKKLISYNSSLQDEIIDDWNTKR
jgi:Ca-activated chloride channel family protein